jgi:hypothetical protein
VTRFAAARVLGFRLRRQRLDQGTLHLLAADDLPLYVAVLGPRGDDPGDAWLRGYGATFLDTPAELSVAA